MAGTADYIAVVFRGTQEGADWWTNLKFLHRHFPRLGRVHEVIRKEEELAHHRRQREAVAVIGGSTSLWHSLEE